MVFGWGSSGGSQYEAVNKSGQSVMVDISSAMKTLDGKSDICVKERVQRLNALTCGCWESAHKYDVYSGRSGSGSRIFYAEENSGCCCRQVQTMCPDCAPIEVHIDEIGYISNTDNAFKLKKDWSCTFCCINRPVIYMYDKGGNKMGSIRDPCPLCPTNMTFDIRDHEDNFLLHAESGICQWGLCCPCPCGPCKSVDFPVKDSSGNQVGTMEKRMKGLLKMLVCSWCFEDVENYRIEFSKVEDPRQKALLMGLAIFTDFRYFSSTGDDDKPDGE